MKNKKNIFKMCSATLALSLGVTVFVPTASYAAITNDKFLSPVTSTDSNITNVDDSMNKTSDFYYKNKLDNKELGSYWRINSLQSKKTTMDLEINSSDIQNLKYSDSQPEYIGENEFKNDTNEEQIMTTATYSHEVRNFVDSTVTKGFQAKGEGAFFKIPILLPDGIQLNAEFNSNDTEKKTTDDIKTLTASPQNIKVPAGKTYKVEVTLHKKNFVGDIDFQGKATNVKSDLNVREMYLGPGFPRPDRYPTYTYDTADMWKDLTNDQKNQITGIKFDDNKNLILNGTAKLKGIYGSKLQVNIFDITNKSTPKLVQVF